MASDGRGGRPWRRAKARLFAEAPDICSICEHIGGTSDAHHEPPLVMLKKLGLDPCDPQYLRRAHGTMPCPTCGRRCNQEQGAKLNYKPLNTSQAW